MSPLLLVHVIVASSRLYNNLTSFDLILQSSRTVVNELLQWQPIFRNSQVQELLHFCWVMEIQNFLIAVVGSPNEVKQDVYHLLKKLPGSLNAFCAVRKDVCNPISDIASFQNSIQLITWFVTYFTLKRNSPLKYGKNTFLIYSC